MKNLLLFFVFLYSITFTNAQSTTSVDEEKIYVVVQEKSQPYEGMETFSKNLISHLDFSDIKTETGSLSVRVQFVVEKDGSLVDIRILNDTHNVLERVKKAFSQMPNWKPAFYEGKKVRSKFTLPMNILVNTLELPEISFDDELKKSLKNFDIDNEYFSFQCNCKITDKRSKSDYENVRYVYLSLDDSAYYVIEFLDNSKYSTTDLMESFLNRVTKNKGEAKEDVFQGKEVKIIKFQEESEGRPIYQKGIILESKEYITLAYVITHYEDGIDVLFDEFLKSLVIKKIVT